MGNAGYVHWAAQSAKGTANTADGQRIFCTDTDFNVTDLTRMQRPTIGGSALPQGAYKAGTGGAGTFGFEVPGEHIGYLLYFLCGAVSVSTGSPETGVSDTHTFKMATDEFSLPWVTFIEDKEDIIKTQLADCAVVGGRFVFAAGDSLQSMFTVAGITPSFASDPTTPTDDTTDIMVCSIETDAYFKVNDAAVDAQQVIVDVTNIVPGLQEEMKIGSPYRRDISKMARNVTVTLRSWVDATWWKAVYFNTGTTWSAAVYQDDIAVKAATGTNMSGAADPYSLEFKAAEVTFGPCRAPVTARRITMVETQGVATVPSAGEDFEFDLVVLTGTDYTAVPS